MTGDDFGISIPVNDAIIKSHEKGILTTTSLMITADAVEDAVTKAKSLPNLNVGMHLVLSNGKPALPAYSIPTLVNRNELFLNNALHSGLLMFFSAAAKRQLAKEIRAQFEAFKKTGLRLDHVNAHKHLHLHPNVFDLIIEIGKDYGLTAIRIPNELPLKSIINSKKESGLRYLRWLLLIPLIAHMKKKCIRNNIKFNDRIYGFNDSGHMNIETLIRILPHIEEGLTEIYTHPATTTWDKMDTATMTYEFEAEYKALIHARTLRTIKKFDIQLVGFNA